MRFYQDRSGSGHVLPVEIAGYSKLDAGTDGWASLTTDEKPGRPTPSPEAPAWRREGARALRFWRRFDKSLLRQKLKEIPEPQERLDALFRFLAGYKGRFPTVRELNQLEDLLRQVNWASGNIDVGDAVEIASLVNQYLPRIPDSVFQIIGDRRGAEYKESDDDADDLEVTRAGWSEVLPRERFGTPKMLRLEKRGRGALTKWQWLEAHYQMDKAHVEFLVDSSGSMGTEKFALAIAGAIKLGRRFAKDGHRVSMRFAANRLGPRLTPEEAIGFAASDGKRHLGGGDFFGDDLHEASKEKDVTDFVVVSDHCITFALRGRYVSVEGEENRVDANGMEYWLCPQTMHTVYIESGEHPDPTESPWWARAKTKYNWSGFKLS